VQTVDWGAQDANDAPGFVVVWDLRSLSTPPIRVPTGTGIQGVGLSPDGQTLYTPWPLTAYEVASGDRIWRREDVTSDQVLDVNAEGTLLAVTDLGEAHTERQVLLVSASTGATVHTLREHRDAVLDIRFSPDGSLVGSVSGDNELIVWDTASGRLLERWDSSGPFGVGFGADGDLVYGGYGDSMLRTWDRSMEETYLQQAAQVGDGTVFAHADFSPDGQQVAYSWLDGDTGWIRFVNTLTGEATPPARVAVSEGPWASGAWNPQGDRYVASCVTGGCVDPTMVLDAATGRVLEEEEFLDGEVLSIAYVDGGRSLLVGGSVVRGGWRRSSSLRTLMVDAETLHPRGEPFAIPSHWVVPVGDGSIAMVHEYSGDLQTSHWQVIDFSTGNVLSEGDLNISAYAFTASRDGSTVAMAGDTGDIVTVDVSTGDQRRPSTSLGAAVLWLKYSDDGELLVSGADDGGVSLWDATTLDLLGTVYPPHDGEAVPAAAQFIGDSHDVAIASHDGRVYRWETDVERAIDFACQMAGRSLTEEEWEEVLPEQPYRDVCPRQ
jgi:WD40 repeat protein